jgi:hypothetical protein
MSLYAYGRTELSHLSTPALNIIHRWQSIVYNLSYNYDKSNHDAKQRDLRERILQMRRNKGENLSNDDEELISRNPNGVMVMQSSNFDFIDHPEVKVEEKALKTRSNTAKDLIRKVFETMDKKKKASIL